MQEVEEPQFSSESESEFLDNEEKTSKLKCKYCNKEFLTSSLKKHEELCSDSKKDQNSVIKVSNMGNENTEPVVDQIEINEKPPIIPKDNEKKLCQIEGCDYDRKNKNYQYHLMTIHFNQKLEKEFGKFWNISSSRKLECPDADCKYSGKSRHNFKVHCWYSHAREKYMKEAGIEQSPKVSNDLDGKRSKLPAACTFCGKQIFSSLERHINKVHKKNGQQRILKNVRHRFTEEQISILKKIYAQNSYPEEKQIEGLAIQIGVKEKQIKNWFKSNRHKQNGQNKISIPNHFFHRKKSPKEDYNYKYYLSFYNYKIIF